ncbi:MAG: AMP-binding protein, partial [Mycobacteriaceae bacterium]
MRVHEEIYIDAPLEQVWQILADPADYPGLLDSIAAFDPEDPDQQPGQRARYTMRFAMGSAEVGGTVEIVEYDPPRDISWTSVTGIDQRGHLRLREASGGRTRLEFRFGYEVPGTVLGTVAELVSIREVSRRLRRGLRNVQCAAAGSPRPARGGGRSLIGGLLHETENLRILARTGLLAPMRPDKLVRLGLAAARWGASPATAMIAGAIRHPQVTMLVDELGALTWAEVDGHTNAVANGLRAAGVGEGDRVGLMCRDHRGFVEAAIGAAKLGADVLLLNTSFAAPQLTEVCQRENVAALVYDEEFCELVADAGRDRIRFVAWHEGTPADTPLAELVAHGDASAPPPPGRSGRVTILTSGTTGSPKGAERGNYALTLDPPAALLERIPLREGQCVVMGAPLFHAWGFANLMLGMALGSTFVLRRRFDPEQCLADIAEHHATALVVVPVMLQRILELPEQVRNHYDTSSLQAVCASGSSLPGELATRWMDQFGDNLYNMYGSTEVAVATLARPADLRAAPGTAGKPTRGSIVRLYDDRARAALQGRTGRIFVGNTMLFEGYTGGGSKDVIDGLMASGDVGYFDPAGRLFVRGRDDEMIVSGGENVFPKEVEDVMSNHATVAEVACIGVDDEKFGQRLRAFVVLRDGQDANEEQLKAHVKSTLARY